MKLSTTFQTPTDDGLVLLSMGHIPALDPLPAALARLNQAQDAMRCAADYLRLGAPGKALEVLELNLR
jgi:hypothetical protein